MKKIIMILVTCLAMIGCGVDVTDPQAGYFDKSTDNSVNIDNSIHYSENTKDTVIIKDTIEKKIVDTIVDTLKQIKIDTVIKHKVDTLKQIKVDTVKSVKIDTVKIVKVDTVKQTIIDTVYKKITDTVYTSTISYSNKSSEYEPKDTIFTLSEEIDGVLYTKSYKGIVYKNVFYDTTKYEFQYKKGGNLAGYNYINIIENYGQNFSEADIKYIHSGNSSLFEANLWVTNACGVIDKPVVTTITYNTRDPKRFKGFHIADVTDLAVLGSYIGDYVDETIKIYAGVDGNVYHYTNKSGVILSGSNRPTHYLCAYELK